jgi:CDP-diacylglycerol pyrophosphatase
MQASSLGASARRRRSGILWCAALALAVSTAAGPTASAADPDILWKIVHDKCVPDQQQHHKPAPCQRVDLQAGAERGYAVLKDIKGDTQFLLIPTARVTGIESPLLLAPHAPNYWAPAWAARRYVFSRAHKWLPRTAISLAVNSAQGRSQNQLHIHVDCVRPDLRTYLAEHAASLSQSWSDLGTTFGGHHYVARRLDSRDLRGVDPFDLLADGIATARDDMGNWTLVVVGMAPRGFVLLAGHVDPGSNDNGSGEELQDHGCALAAAL